MFMKQDKKITFANKYLQKSQIYSLAVMKIEKKYFFVYQCFMALFLLFSVGVVPAAGKDFTVVLDAGHGGHDPGAVGTFAREKDLNLAVVLNLGSIIERKFRDVNVVYTRKTDKYLTLQERANIVNDNHADLFICIHTNSAQSKSAAGAETFTLGLAKSKSNLDVAMRENSVILLEDNYKTKYKGFDPNSVDSYIMFEFMQDKYIDKSIEFSSIVQKQFVKHCNRQDRGVRQAGFWVLHRSACPSVLVELGFVSNLAEERYLASKQGQNELATAIFNAFVDYKYVYDRKSGIQSTDVVEKISKKQMESETQVLESTDSDNVNLKTIPVVEKPDEKVTQAKQESPAVQEVTEKVKTTKEETINLSDIANSTIAKSDKVKSEAPIFKVQLFALTKKVTENSRELKGVKNTSFYKEGAYYKYTVGEETDYKIIQKIKAEISKKFPEAFIIAFVGDKKMTAKEALKLVN